MSDVSAEPVHWSHRLDEPAHGTAAWIVTTAALEQVLGGGLNPTACDRRDVGPRRGPDAERFLLRRSALRFLAGRWCGVSPADVVIGYDATGRPGVLTPREVVHCSVSARGDIVGFALSRHPVGIDLEPMAAGDIAWAALSGLETTALKQLPAGERPAAFLQIWTLKEAYLKVLGTGLLRDPAGVTVARLENRIEDGAARVSLPPSSTHHMQIGTEAVVAACIAIPPQDLPAEA